MEHEVIRVEHLSKAYKLYDKKSDRVREVLSTSGKQYYTPFFALKDVSFSIKRGETVGIVGANGSGKSTLLKILAGVSAPTEGSVFINGKVSALLELGAGFNAEYTGLENIALNGTMMGYSKVEMEQRREGIIHFADIGEYINQPVKNYSSGMFARLAFAVAISVEPEILIVDEALSVGDMRFQIKCMDRMKRMMEGGTTILYVSHDTSSIRRFCERALWINNGALAAAGEVNSIADMYEDYLRGMDTSVEAESLFSADASPDEEFSSTPPEEGVIARITRVRVCDEGGRDLVSIGYAKPVNVVVDYDVYDEHTKAPVLGVAIFRGDGDYVCGLNTLLDQVRIPWRRGRNRASIFYPDGLRVLGGQYYFDAALRDQTATVNIDYKTRVYDILVESGYLAEGRLVLPHRWSGE